MWPLVSVGLPVYNGERFLRAALDSLLAQDYPNFELTISDNASDDATEAICREYAARDVRVRYYRAEQNMGAVWNFRRALELSGGEYFMWAAFDDVRDTQYIGKCVAELERNPRAVLCCTGVRRIDEHGREVAEPPCTLSARPVGASRRERLLAIARANFWYDFYGLMRRRVLAQTRLPQPVWGFDVLLTLEMCLRGEVVALPEKLFSYRYFEHKTEAEMATTLAPVAVRRAIPVSWSNLALEMTRSIMLAPLPLSERVKLAWAFVREFCLRNELAREGIRRERTENVAGAFRKRRIALAAGLALVSGLVVAADHGGRLSKMLFSNRLMNSLKYRCGRIWKTAFRDH